MQPKKPIRREAIRALKETKNIKAEVKAEIKTIKKKKKINK